ncbi:Mitochondrial carrier domain-containing protein [Cynara cardunculus var. scolymus]|uniref:Mitochondrial carrier domain-containing protein n=1 Tax=Cynara cardunculus var. scolymus TaxID=59895 RepID=A0A118K408_CYNCS|nr:Mitochondrial carrier domain-containing protein [Cynara cardunculus var. scolymus]
MGVKGFIEGVIAFVIAGCSTHPLDLIKVCMQLQGESPPVYVVNGGGGSTMTIPWPLTAGLVSVGVNIFKTQGIVAFFSSVSATVLRQTLYSTTRMGLYDIFKQKWFDTNMGKLSLTQKIGSGLLAGGIGTAVGNPVDVAIVRMQADGSLSTAQRRNYKGVADAITRMVKKEGIKETLLSKGVMKDRLGTHVMASFAAGFVVVKASNPVDVIKTRVMNMKMEEGVAPPYKVAVDCAVKAKGRWLYTKGFIPTISRKGPFTVIFFVTLEQVRKIL